MLSESLSGIASIRANNAVEHFQKKFRTVHDAHGRYQIMFSRHSLAVAKKHSHKKFFFHLISQDDLSSPSSPAVVGLGFEWMRSCSHFSR